MKKISHFSVVAMLSVTVSVSMLSGCSYNRVTANNTEYMETKSLSDDMAETGFSDAQQFLYSITRVKPEGSNNLDDFNAFQFTQTDPTLANAAGAALAIPQSPWLALNNFLVSQGRDQVTHYRNNMLILLSPMKSTSSTPKEDFHAEVVGVADELTADAMTMIKGAYNLAGTPVDHVFADVEQRSGHFSWFSPEFIIPSNVDYCPSDIESLDALGDSELEYCSTALTNRLFVNFNNPANKHAVPLAINGSYGYKIIYLPDGFPVEFLKSDNPNSYVFMPSFMYHKSNILSKMDKNAVLDMAREGRISLNPLLKNIHTGEYHYFNDEIKSYQESPLIRIDEEKVFSSSQL
ncbi:hypothetical protein REH81_04380 [Vibrio rotiferianus]